MKISKERLMEIILQECEMVDGPEVSYNMDGIDKEGLMAKRQLQDMENYARELSQMLTDTTQLESWVQAKLTKAADYLKTVKHYVEYGMEEGAYDQVMSGMNPIEPVSGVDMEIIDLDEEQIAKIAEE
tara:strand:- start:5192 stop:5575 length:384 start_codon:yes stop_codon:yes gene_type:complete